MGESKLFYLEVKINLFFSAKVTENQAPLNCATREEKKTVARAHIQVTQIQSESFIMTFIYMSTHSFITIRICFGLPFSDTNNVTNRNNLHCIPILKWVELNLANLLCIFPFERFGLNNFLLKYYYFSLSSRTTLKRENFGFWPWNMVHTFAWLCKHSTINVFMF